MSKHDKNLIDMVVRTRASHRQEQKPAASLHAAKVAAAVTSRTGAGTSRTTAGPSRRSLRQQEQQQQPGTRTGQPEENDGSEDEEVAEESDDDDDEDPDSSDEDERPATRSARDTVYEIAAILTDTHLTPEELRGVLRRPIVASVQA